MKNFSRGFIILFFFTAASFGQQFTRAVRGVEHTSFARKLGADPVAVNMLRLNLRKVRLDVVHAKDRAVGVESTSAIAKRKGALAAINAGFFRLDSSEFAGEAAGILQIDGKLWSESFNDRVALMITNNKKTTEVSINRLRTSVTLGYGVDSVIGVNGINRERGKAEVILYTPAFGIVTPYTKRAGAEFGFQVECDSQGLACRGRLVSVNDGQGGSAIPPDGVVVSIDSEKEEFAQHTGAIKQLSNNSLTLRIPFFVTTAGKEPLLENFILSEDIVGGVGQLIKSGKIDITWREEKASQAFVEMRHPRTAVAKLKDGKFLMVTVDGRQPGYSVGMSLPELAEMLLEFGAVDAMNLDGGGSTTMFLKDKVVNKPSDKTGERAVSDAIVVFPRK
jgi:hypothetical protein